MSIDGVETNDEGSEDLNNQGILWITSFETDNNETATRLKVMKVEGENILIMFEVWDPDFYKYTAYLTVDKEGQSITKL